MPRFFTLQQAEQLLPEVQSAMQEAIALKSEYQRSETAWQSFSRRITLLGGVQVDPSELQEQKRARETNVRRLKAAIGRIHEFGCLVKDLDVGLIDFPTLLEGVEVYLCWKVGETGIHFWHGVEEGFRGRKPIDQHFLEHHQGELPN
jgi:hypothetical protein